MLIRILNKFEEIFIAILLTAMTVVTFTQVVLRYVFSSGLRWGLELTTYLFGWLVLFGASYVLKKRSHICIDMAVKVLSPAKQRLMGLLAASLSLIYCGILIYGGWNYVSAMHTLGVETQDMPIQRWVFLSILPIGFTLLLLRLFKLTWDIWTGQEIGFRQTDMRDDALKQEGLLSDEMRE